MSQEKLHILQHSLGVNKYGQGNQYRNRFITGPESSDFPSCQTLVDEGLMVDRGEVAAYGGMHLFSVTPKGIDYVAFNSAVPPKLSRSAQRYRDYLRSDCGHSFGEWLQYGGYKPCR